MATFRAQLGCTMREVFGGRVPTKMKEVIGLAIQPRRAMRTTMVAEETGIR